MDHINISFTFVYNISEIIEELNMTGYFQFNASHSICYSYNNQLGIFFIYDMNF